MTFHVTGLADANSGFADVSIVIDNMYATAKADCRGDFMYDDNQASQTAFILAWTATSGDNEQTFLNQNDIEVTCTYGNGPEDDKTAYLDASTPPGEIDPIPLAPPLSDLFDRIAVYRGREFPDRENFEKGYWSFAFALKPLSQAQLDALGTCHIRTQASPSDDWYSQLPPTYRFPVIDWDVPIIARNQQNQSQVQCYYYGLDAGDGAVDTVFTDGPLDFDNYFDPNGENYGMSTPTEPYRYDDNNGVTVRRIQPPWFYFVGNRYSLATATSIPYASDCTARGTRRFWTGDDQVSYYTADLQSADNATLVFVGNSQGRGPGELHFWDGQTQGVDYTTPLSGTNPWQTELNINPNAYAISGSAITSGNDGWLYYLASPATASGPQPPTGLYASGGNSAAAQLVRAFDSTFDSFNFLRLPDRRLFLYGHDAAANTWRLYSVWGGTLSAPIAAAAAPNSTSWPQAFTGVFQTADGQVFFEGGDRKIYRLDEQNQLALVLSDTYLETYSLKPFGADGVVALTYVFDVNGTSSMSISSFKSDGTLTQLATIASLGFLDNGGGAASPPAQGTDGTVYISYGGYAADGITYLYPIFRVVPDGTVSVVTTESGNVFNCYMPVASGTDMYCLEITYPEGLTRSLSGYDNINHTWTRGVFTSTTNISFLAALADRPTYGQTTLVFGGSPDGDAGGLNCWNTSQPIGSLVRIEENGPNQGDFMAGMPLVLTPPPAP